MIPILASAGAGAAWLFATIAQLVLWGFGISMGFALGQFAQKQVAIWTAKARAKKIVSEDKSFAT